MEGLTRLVTESLARHGFDRPVDYRRLHWSRWFRCESHHSLLVVPSKPGVFALAEEIMDLGTTNAHVATGASPVPRNLSEAKGGGSVEERRFSAASSGQTTAALAAVGRRMLAVTQFFEDDDMAFVLDRMLSRQNPMRVRLISGRYFVRFVVIEDPTQRRSICSALNQWMANSAEKATGIGSHFATSLELTPQTEYTPQTDDAQQSLFADLTANREGHAVSRAEQAVEEQRFSAASSAQQPAASAAEGRSFSAAISSSPTAPHLDSGAATNIHCPSPFPSGF